MKDLMFKERPARKLVDQYIGPYIIDKVVSTNVVKLQLLTSMRIHLFVNVSWVVWYRKQVEEQKTEEVQSVKLNKAKDVVATTCCNGTHSLLTSAKLANGLSCSGELQENSTRSPHFIHLLYIYMAPGPCYNNIYLVLKSMPLPHVHYSSTMHLP